ncbi:MAG: hypothetical protein V7760_08395 [Marinobacter sp.]
MFSEFLQYLFIGITIGASIFIRGLAQLVWGKKYHVMPNFSSDEPIEIFGAVLNSQSLWLWGQCC